LAKTAPETVAAHKIFGATAVDEPVILNYAPKSLHDLIEAVDSSARAH
jgi:hypothetical protein